MRMWLLLAVYAVLHVLLLGVGIAVGFLLVWMIPDIGIGTGIVIGVLSSGMSVHFFARMLGAAATYNAEQDEQDDEGTQFDPPVLVFPALSFSAHPKRVKRTRR